jgi:hypothetical protein
MQKRLSTLFAILFVAFSGNALGQWTDNFNDGDFTQSPAWSGSSASWVVSAGKLRSDNTTTNTSFFLTTPSNTATSAQWDLWINLQFATSSTNYVDVFLISDNPDLTASPNGYFVRLGGTTDEVSLFRTGGTSGVKIIDGADNALSSSSNNLIRLRVSRDAANLWTLRRDLTGTGQGFVTEGTVNDGLFTTSSYFGFLVKQSTASFFQKHFFDDISVGPIQVDTTPPQVLSARVSAPSTLDVLFSEAVDPASASQVSNYNLTNNLGPIVTASPDLVNAALVHLTTSVGLDNGLENQVTVAGVADQAANVMVAPQTVSFYFPRPFDIIINEIMADPDPPVALPNAEYIELYNRSNKTIHLDGFVLTIGSTDRTLSSYTLAPGGFVVLTAPANLALFTLANAIGLTGMSTSSLTNTGTRLQLKTNLGTFLHEVEYSDTWYDDASKADGGWSLEARDASNPCGGNANWSACQAPDGGTPGIINSINSNNPDVILPQLSSVSAQNSSQLVVIFSEPVLASAISNAALYNVSPVIGNPIQVLASGSVVSSLTLVFGAAFNPNEVYNLSFNGQLIDCSGNVQGSLQTAVFSTHPAAPFEVVINEIMADPDPAQGLPNAEFIELFNRSAFPISLAKWTLTYGSTTKVIPAGSIAPNGYAVIPVEAAIGSFVSYGNIIRIPGLGSFLSNSGTTLLIKDSLGNEIHQVFYSDAWYRDPAKAGGGWSLEQIDPLNPCGGLSNWRASLQEEGGTPGYQNSVSSGNPDNQPPRIANVCTNGPNLEVQFSEPVLSSAVSQASYYDIPGIGNPTSVALQPGYTCTSVNLIFSQTLPPDQDYTLVLTQPLTDCAGNSSLNQSSFVFSFYQIKPFELVINEILADPDPAFSLPSAEFIELFNTTSRAVSLQGWSLRIGGTNRSISCTVIPANGYLLLSSASDVDALKSFGPVASVAGFTLTNAGTDITLLNPSGEVISRVVYSDAWYATSLKRNGGWSLEQVDPKNPCAGAANWRESKAPLGGTPGSRNSVAGSNPDQAPPRVLRAYPLGANQVRVTFSEPLNRTTLSSPASFRLGDSALQPTAVFPQAPSYQTVVLIFGSELEPGKQYWLKVSNSVSDCVGNLLSIQDSCRVGLPEKCQRGDLLISELLPDPYSGGSDFVEVYNASGKVLDLKEVRLSGWDTIASQLISISAIDTTGFLAFPGEYYVLTRDPDIQFKYYEISHAENMVGMESFPSMNIDGGSVALSLWNDEVLDRAAYTSSMHYPLLSSSKGVSLERITFQNSALSASNWGSASSASGFATPTGINSQAQKLPDGSNPIALSSDIFSPDNDGYQDVLLISCKQESGGNRGTLSIYDRAGRRIRKLADGALLGTEDAFVWNGFTDEGDRAELGMYLIVLEVLNLDGTRFTYRKPVVVATRL